MRGAVTSGDTFTEFGYEEDLIEPICQASMVRYTDANQHDKNRILFSNPASTSREQMTIRISYDECHSWSSGKVLHAGSLGLFGSFALTRT